jgi:hypothetical protein
MTLPYCPNCRHDLDEQALGWICWRISAGPVNVAPGAADSQAAAVHYGKTKVEYRGQREPTLCEHYNSPEADVCMSRECGAPKVPGRFRPACSICEMELPSLTDLSSHAITIAGPASAGKTHYIVAVNEWWTNHLPALGPTVLPAMGRRLTERFETLRRRVIDQSSTLEATVAGEMISFSWQILPQGGTTQGLLLTLPDASGERMLDQWALAENRHFHFCSGIILILDGDRVAVAHQLPVQSKRDPSDHLKLINAMLLDLNSRLTPQERSGIPIAVCVNKVDMLSSRSEQWERLMATHNPDHDGYFDYRGCADRSAEIEALLLSKAGTKAIVHLLKNNFMHVMFFAMATIGSSPAVDGGEGGTIVFAPFAVGDPFLWLLWQLGIVEMEQ